MDPVPNIDKHIISIRGHNSCMRNCYYPCLCIDITEINVNSLPKTTQQTNGKVEI